MTAGDNRVESSRDQRAAIPQSGDLGTLQQLAVFPEIADCFVTQVSGDVTSNSAFYNAINEGMLPLSRVFVDSLVEAVSQQEAIALDILANEETSVRKAVEQAGNEHGTSGFKDRVVWLSQNINYLSCTSEADPSHKGETLVPLLSYQLYDPRAYRSAQLTVQPNQAVIGLGQHSIIGSSPSFYFEFEANGQALWESMLPFLGKLSRAVPERLEEFNNVQEVTWKSPNQGCYYASTQDGLCITLKPMRPRG